jgi:hypothetical protein
MDILSPTIKCPDCGAEIPLTETIAAPLIAQIKEETEGKLREALDSKKEAEQKLRDELQSIEKARDEIDTEVSKKVGLKLVEQEKAQREKIREELESEIKGAKEREQEVTDRLKKSQEENQELLKAKQKAELDVQAAKLEAQKEAQTEISALREIAQKEAEESQKLKFAEQEKKISDLLNQLEDAKRKAQQGSQQMQGEIMELDLEETLRQIFPWDDIEPVKAGQRGGDLMHKVMSGPGIHAGTVMWEIKRTQNWGGDWPAKAKHDALNSKAELVIIVSDVVPKGIDCFGFFEGVWVCRPTFAVALAHALRQQMDQVANARRMAAGKQTKSEILYDYMTGPEFRARLEGIVEPFVQMQKDLDSEKRAITNRWNKRQKQIERVLMSASSLSGDLQGIGGSEMPELPAFTDSDTDLELE